MPIGSGASTLCSACQTIFHGLREIRRTGIHGENSRYTNDGYELFDGESSDLEGSSTNRKRVQPIYVHQETFAHLEQSARDGCRLCKLLLVQYPQHERERMRKYEEFVRANHPARARVYYSISCESKEDDPPYIIGFHCRLPRPGEEAVTGCKTYRSYASVDLIASEVIENIHLMLNPNIAPRTDSDSSWQVVERWLDRCTNNHPKCTQRWSKRWFPTRLVGIGLSADNTEVRLCDSSAIPPNSRYITLSHCWGTLPIKRLLTSTLSSFQTRIDFDELPKTFQHAITITRKLSHRYGVRHIWIDSLCIIQDSLEDWRNESAQMGNVYSNSWCNLAATGARDGRDGCFFERDLDLVQPCRIEAEWRGLRKGGYYCIDRDVMKRNVSEAPLCRRGWVVQERLLASRVLHFGTDQLYWECMEHDASETFPLGMPSCVEGRVKDLTLRAGAKDRLRSSLPSDPFWMHMPCGSGLSAPTPPDA